MGRPGSGRGGAVLPEGPAMRRPGRLPLVLLALLSASLCHGTTKLSSPRVLLPYCKEVRVSFILRAGGGCYSCQDREVTFKSRLADLLLSYTTFLEAPFLKSVPLGRRCDGLVTPVPSDAAAYAATATSNPEGDGFVANPLPLPGPTEQRRRWHVLEPFKPGRAWTSGEGASGVGERSSVDGELEEQQRSEQETGRAVEQVESSPEESQVVSAAQEVPGELPSHASGEAWPFQWSLRYSVRRLLMIFIKTVAGNSSSKISLFSTRPDVVSVTPVYTNGSSCSQMAFLSSQSMQPTRLGSVIITEDQVTGHLVRCDVVVDLIHSIEIVSRSRELYLDDAPLELAVRAMDQEGNTFSSLSGISFEWSIVKDDKTENIEPSNRIRILKYSEAEYTPPDYIAEMELRQKQGDLILVSGIRTGASVIKVRVLEPVYRFVEDATVRLFVLENIFLLPSNDVYLLVGAYIRYRVSRLIHGKITEVDLPLEHYDLELQNEDAGSHVSMDQTVADLDINTVTVTALQLGLVNLVFIHKNIHMRGALGLPKSTIHVVEAGSLGFSVFPGDRWVLEVYRDYEITVEVYEKGCSNRVFPSDNLRIKMELPSEFLKVKASSVNGSHHLVQVVKSGIFYIKGQLIGVQHQDGILHMLEIPIGHVQEVQSFHPIVLTPSVLAFPHHPREIAYRYQIQIQGGSGNFTWVSSNQTVAIVTMKGVVVTGVVIGQCLVQARDVLNPYHYGEVKVFVLKLSKMELVPVQGDVEIGQALDVPIVMYGIDQETGETIAFTDCSLLPLEVTMDKPGVLSLVEGWHKYGQEYCTSIQFMAESPGYTLVTIFSVVYDEYFESSATFAIFEPLKAVNPTELALVTLNSVKEMVFEGGPRPWVLEPSRFFVEMEAEVEELIKKDPVWPPGKRKQSQYIYRILCLELGAQVLTFRVGNVPGPLNLRPAVKMVQVQFICALPASMSVSPVYKVTGGAQPCPLSQHNTPLLPISCSRNSIMELAAFDQHHRKFDNFSSLLIEWESSNETLAQFVKSEAMQMVEKGDGTGQTRLHGHRILHVDHKKGTLFVTVTSVGYVDKVIPREWCQNPMTATVELLLVDDVSVVPSRATIFNHQDLKEVFHLVEGSGYYLVNMSDADVINVTYQEAASNFQVTPLKSGTVTIAVHDLCLAFHGPVIVHISVSDILEMDLDFIDKVEVGKIVPVILRVLNAYKHPFPNKYFKSMDLQLQAATPIINLLAVEASDTFCASFLLKAIVVGQTTLIVTARDKARRKLTSIPRQVEVFPPFRLVPDHMTLIPKNMMQVMSEGGPQLQSIIHFSISNRTVAVVNRLGQVTAIAVGVATVHGTIQAINEDTGKVIVFSQDSAEVEVVQLRGVRIHTPATRLITGTKMPVYVMGLTSTLTPFSFSNSRPRLKFHWSISKRDVLDLEARHSEVPLIVGPENSFSVVLHTKAAGRTGLKVTVHCQNVSTGQFEGDILELSDEVQILVFEKLQLFSPRCPAEQILMSMSSHLRLCTNREGAAFVSSRVLQCFPNSSVIEEGSPGVLTAGAISGTAVLEVTSLEAFGVNQTTITGVRVAPVSYLRISTSPKLHTVSGALLTAFPLGMALTLTIHFYDSIGEMFHAQNTRLHLAMNRDDLLLIGPGKKNYTYAAQAVNRGVTLLGIWDQKHPGLADYIPLPVEHAITPNLLEPVAVGDVICFTTPLVNKDGEPGLWHISTSDIMDVDTISGAAVAKRPGKATVFYDIPGMLRTYREVVVNSSTLALTISPRSYLTNTPNSTETHLLIATSRRGYSLWHFCLPAQEQAITYVLRPENHLTCTVSFTSSVMDIPASSIFKVQSHFCVEKGIYMCVIKTHEQTDDVLLDLSTADTLVSLKASLVSCRGVPEIQRLQVPFFPAFYNNQSELVFSSMHPTNEIRIMGISTVLLEIEVMYDSPGLLVSSQIPSNTITGMVVYLVEAVNLSSILWSQVPVFINISCALTGQLVQLEVKAVKESDINAMQ
ncbi:nuclear pore membrane glycoprotein 210-like [Pleurodeles waltl]